MNLSVAPEFATAFMLVFARIGAMAMFLPGFGESVTPVRLRLSIVIFVTLITLPIVRADLPVGLAAPGLGLVFIREMLIGIVIGLSIRLLASSLQIAGAIISQQLGFSTMTTLDPTGADGGQSATLGNFMALMGVTLVLASDLHHVALTGLIGSYRAFAPGVIMPDADMLELALRVVTESFAAGLRIAAPFLVFGIVFNLGLGILSRMMPQLQVFFLALPASILLGTLIFILVIGPMMDGYLAYLARMFELLIPGATS
jgi:flagellar biosynthetic protein FliR